MFCRKRRILVYTSVYTYGEYYPFQIIRFNENKNIIIKIINYIKYKYIILN